MTTDTESKILNDLKPFHFAVTMRGEWLYCQVPASGNRKWLERVSTYISTYQLNSIFVNARRDSVEEEFGKPYDPTRKLKKVPEPGDCECPLIRWELTACINDATSIGSDSNDIATVTLAASETIEQILAEQDRLIEMLSDGKKSGEPATTAAAGKATEITLEQPASTSLFDVNDAARTSAREQLKAVIDGRVDGQDPMLEFNPLDLLLKKGKGSDGKST